MSDARPIGVFDSGVGGLTVVRALVRALPQESFVYLGDTARVPYGTKSADTVIRFSNGNVRYLLRRGVKMVVVACHTSSSCALATLEANFDLPILGVTAPGGRAAASATQSGRIGVIGTRATIASGAFEREIRAHRPGVDITSRPCPLFVPLVEEGWEGTDVARRVALKYLAPFVEEGVDTLVLGCTHYPLLRPVIEDVMGEDIRLVDPGEETAREAVALLRRENLAVDAPGGSASDAPAPTPTFRFIVSDVSPRMETLARACLGREVGNPEVVPMETLEEMERSR